MFQRPGDVMAVYKRKKIWYIDYRANGRRYKEAIGKSKRLAEAVLAKRKAEIAENRFLDVAKARETTFEQLSGAYMDWAWVNKQSADRDKRSIQTLARWFGARRITEITPLSLEKYKRQRSREVCGSTVNRELACLKHMFNKAIAWDLADENPVKKVRMFKEPPGRVRYLSHDEISRLLDAATSHLKPIIMVALLTGMRKSEILRLNWKDLDFERQLIMVRNSKNGEARQIAMSHEVEAILSRLPRVHKQIFTRADSKPVLDIKTCFERAVRLAKIEDFSFHDLRHTFASYMMMNGAELLTVSRILGHKTINMTLRYAHLSPAFQRDAMNKLSILNGPKMVPRPKADVARRRLTGYPATNAGVVELVDTRDLKSLGP